MSARHHLRQLLTEQRQHDEQAHRDVYFLDSRSRMSHLVHHFSKYAGRLSGETTSSEVLTRTIVDAFIVALSAAELLRIDVGAELTTDINPEPSTIHELAVILAPASLDQIGVGEWLFRQLASNAGLCAKAMESLDHLERFDYRGQLDLSVKSILIACVVASEGANIDLGSTVRERWRFLESRLVAQEL